MMKMFGVIIIVLTLLGNGIMLDNKAIKPGNIGLIEVSKNENTINIKGMFVLESSKSYKDYNYRFDGSDLYITVFGTIATKNNRCSNFDITIDTKSEHIKNVYLENEDEIRLVWSENNSLQ